MSVKRKVVDKRLTLFRTCGICGKSFVTTADTPWVRQVPRDGKRQATTYYCSTTCYQASYKYKGWYDGKTEERRREREKKYGNTTASISASTGLQTRRATRRTGSTSTKKPA